MKRTTWRNLHVFAPMTLGIGWMAGCWPLVAAGYVVRAVAFFMVSALLIGHACDKLLDGYPGDGDGSDPSTKSGGEG